MSGSEGPRPGPAAPPRGTPGWADASALVGATPRDGVVPVSLAVRHHLLPLLHEGGTAVVLAVSGGADSLALGVCATDVCARAGVPVLSVTIDHGLREGSDTEAAAVASLMGRLGAHTRVLTLTPRPDRRGGGGPEGGARAGRRAALRHAARGWAREVGAARVLLLLGHTMDDQAETVLLGLARGSGPGSLRGMATVRADEGGSDLLWVRPLLGVRRSQTRACVEALGLDPVEDPTNRADGPWRAADGSALRRAAVRERALPELARSLGVDPVPALARTAELLARDDDTLDALAADLWASALVDSGEDRDDAGPGGPAPAPAAGGTGGRRRLTLDTRALAGAPPALRDRVLHRALTAVSGAPGSVTSTHVRAVAALLTHWHGQGPTDVPGARVGRGRGGALVLEGRDRTRRESRAVEPDPAQAAPTAISASPDVTAAGVVAP